MILYKMCFKKKRVLNKERKTKLNNLIICFWANLGKFRRFVQKNAFKVFTRGEKRPSSLAK